MQAIRPIPRMLLNQTMEVREPLSDGTYGAAKTIGHVRFERCEDVSDDAHRAAYVSGTIFVDGVMSEGAYQVPVGSRIGIGGLDLYVRQVKRFEGAQGRIHHWELSVS